MSAKEEAIKIIKTWEELKQSGSDHYKNGGEVEPIDLYRAGGLFRPFAICSIIKYAYRNRGGGKDEDPVRAADMDKIIHYAQLLKAACREG